MGEDEYKNEIYKIKIALIHILKLLKPQPLGLDMEWFENQRKATDKIIEILEKE